MGIVVTRQDVYEHFISFVRQKYPEKAEGILDPLNQEMAPHLKLSKLMEAATRLEDNITNELKIQICEEMQTLNSNYAMQLFDYMTPYLDEEEDEEVRIAALSAFNTHAQFSGPWANSVKLSEFSTYEGQVAAASLKVHAFPNIIPDDIDQHSNAYLDAIVRGVEANTFEERLPNWLDYFNGVQDSEEIVDLKRRFETKTNLGMFEVDP